MLGVLPIVGLVADGASIQAVKEGGIYGPSIDACEEAIATLPPAECPVTHAFVNGFYIRTILMPAGTVLTSKIHKTRHPFWITKGRIRVWTAEQGTLILEAGHVGITEPGTRRVLYAEEDTVWTTFHATDKTTVPEVEEEIIEPHVNPLVPYADAFGNQPKPELENVT